MKKAIIIFLSALLCLGLCGCGKDGGETVSGAFSASALGGDSDGDRAESRFSAQKNSSPANAAVETASPSKRAEQPTEERDENEPEQTQSESAPERVGAADGDSAEDSNSEESRTEKNAAPPNQNAPEQSEPENKQNSCAFLIDCSKALSSPNLPEKLRDALPRSGVIFSGSVELSEGDSVFDILARVTRSGGIPMEFSSSAGFGSKYVEGINSLYEFDCGSNSGWVYFVNGERPSVGCDKTPVNPGDDVRWYYTLDLGNDIDL